METVAAWSIAAAQELLAFVVPVSIFVVWIMDWDED
jgi:hypothetical protein